MLMKSKILPIALLVVLGVGTWLLLNRLDSAEPSPEMLKLRNTEKSLAIPKPKQKAENDKGCLKDKNGAKHCERRITYYYESDNYWPGFENRLQQSGWDKILDNFYISESSSEETLCLVHDGANSDRLKSSLTLSDGLSDSDCQTRLGY
jgi:hypothetical protein